MIALNGMARVKAGRARCFRLLTKRGQSPCSKLSKMNIPVRRSGAPSSGEMRPAAGNQPSTL